MKFIFIGNPGTGKSTLLNGLIGKAVFKSGNSYGSGMTTVLQWRRDDHSGISYADTPGLDDTKIRKQAAAAITAALKAGDDDYKLVFVVTEEAGRIRNVDVATMELVLDAVGQDDVDISYAIIVNKLTKKKIKDIDEDGPKRTKFLSALAGKYSTPFIHTYKRMDELEDEADVVHAVTNDLRKFLGGFPSIRIKPHEVSDVNADGLGAKLELVQKQLDNLLKNNEAQERAMEDLANRNEAKIKKMVDRLAEQKEISNSLDNDARLLKQTSDMQKMKIGELENDANHSRLSSDKYKMEIGELEKKGERSVFKDINELLGTCLMHAPGIVEQIMKYKKANASTAPKK